MGSGFNLRVYLTQKEDGLIEGEFGGKQCLVAA